MSRQAERAAARRAEIERTEARNHAAGLHVTHVETCKACIARSATPTPTTEESNSITETPEDH